MAKEPIKTDLFHFVTVRNPQLLTQNERKIGFVYFPAELVNSSHFMKDLAGLSTKQARKDHLETKAASFTNLKSVKAVRSTATGLYDFSQWLTKYKNTLTSEETEEQSTGVSTLSSISFVSLWDNMVYQTVTKNSLTICDAIVRMLVADNFLKNNDLETTAELIKNENDLRRLANAYVVIDGIVVTNFPEFSAIANKPRPAQYNPLSTLVNRFEATIELNSLKSTLEQLNTTIRLRTNENNADYETVYQQYIEDVEEAYANATLTQDSEGNDVYEDLELPKFNFTPKTIFQDDFLENNVSDKAFNVIESITEKGLETPEQIAEKLKNEIKSQDSIIFKSVVESKKTKKVLYKGGIIELKEEEPPETGYVAGVKKVPGTNNKFYITLGIAYEDALADISDVDVTVTFDNESTLPINLTIAERTENSVLFSSYPNEYTMPDNNQHIEIAGDIELDNEDVLSIDIKALPVEGKKAFGFAGSEKKAAIPLVIQHHGINKIGVVDFRKVEQEVCCYVPGEVSRIENILAKEYRERSTRQLLSTENTTEFSSESEVEKLSDTTTSERNEMATEIASVLNQDKSKDYGASAGVRGKMGMIEFYADGYLNGASSSSSSNSNSTSQTYAEEVTNRALERVVQKVSEKRTSRILREYEENNKHGFDNRGGDGHVTGIYRWVDKIYTNRLINYGKRLVYEFTVPEPSRFFKKAIIETIESGQQPIVLPDGLILPTEPVHPEEFDINSPADIDEINYQEKAGIYGAEVQAPLPEVDYVGTSFTKSEAQGDGSPGDGWKTNKAMDKEIEILEGYKVTEGKIRVFSRKGGDGHKVAVSVSRFLWVLEKNSDIVGNINISSSDTQSINGKVPVSVSLNRSNIANINVVIKCERTPQTYQQWQNETYTAILEAYNNKVLEYERKVREYNDALYATFIPQAPGAEERAMEFNPLLNRALEKRELKRLAVDIMARPFNILTARSHYSVSYTQPILNAALDKHASYIKFFEQAFDWEVMAYNFYPYYYAAQKQWIELLQQSNGTDPIFQAFLQSGMARMEVPVRPGFEDMVTYFMETGDVWMGNSLAVERDDDLYISIAEELQQVEGVVEKEWETRVPTDLTILQANAAPLDETGLPCCHNSDEETGMAHGSSVMVGKDDEVEP